MSYPGGVIRAGCFFGVAKKETSAMHLRVLYFIYFSQCWLICKILLKTGQWYEYAKFLSTHCCKTLRSSVIRLIMSSVLFFKLTLIAWSSSKCIGSCLTPFIHIAEQSTTATFADDTAVVATDSDPTIASQKLQIDLLCNSKLVKKNREWNPTNSSRST
jgi:hypothetical protein